MPLQNDPIEAAAEWVAQEYKKKASEEKALQPPEPVEELTTAGNQYEQTIQTVADNVAKEFDINRIRLGLAVALRADPNIASDIVALSERTGLPQEAVKQNLDYAKELAAKKLFEEDPIDPEWVNAVKDDPTALAALIKDKEALAVVLPKIERTKFEIAKHKATHSKFDRNIVFPVKRGWYGLKNAYESLSVSEAAQKLSLFSRLSKEESPEKILIELQRTNPLMIPVASSFLAMDEEGRKQEMTRLVDVLGKGALAISKNVQEQNKIPQSPAARVASAAASFGQVLKAIGLDPFELIWGTTLESGVQMAPSFALGLVGAPLPFAMIAGFANSYGVDKAASILEILESDYGVKIEDEDSLAKALQNPSIMQDVLKRAQAHAGVVATFDAASFALPEFTGIGKKIAGKGLGGLKGVRAATGAAARLGTTVVAEGVMGAAGEAGGRVAAGMEMDPFEIAMEFFAEMGHAPVTIASSAMRHWHASRQSVKVAESLREIANGVADVELAKKAPKKFSQVLGYIMSKSQGEKIETVYMTVDDFDRVTKTNDLDPTVVAKEFGIDEQYSKAREGGSSLLEIPVGRFLTEIAGTPVADQFIDSIRISPDAPTSAEAVEQLEEARREFGRAARELADKIMKEPESIEARIYEDALSLFTKNEAVSKKEAEVAAQIYTAQWMTRFNTVNQERTEQGLEPLTDNEIWEIYQEQALRAVEKGEEPGTEGLGQTSEMFGRRLAFSDPFGDITVGDAIGRIVEGDIGDLADQAIAAVRSGHATVNEIEDTIVNEALRRVLEIRKAQGKEAYKEAAKKVDQALSQFRDQLAARVAGLEPSKTSAEALGEAAEAAERLPNLFQIALPEIEGKEPVLPIGSVEREILKVLSKVPSLYDLTSDILAKLPGAPKPNEKFPDVKPTSFSDLVDMARKAKENGAANEWYREVSEALAAIVGSANMLEASIVFGVTSAQTTAELNFANTLAIMAGVRKFLAENPNPDLETLTDVIANIKRPGNKGIAISRRQAEKIARMYLEGTFEGGIKITTYMQNIKALGENYFFPYGVMDVHMQRIFGYPLEKGALTEKEYRYAQFMTALVAAELDMPVHEVQALLWFAGKEQSNVKWKTAGTRDSMVEYSAPEIAQIQEMIHEGLFDTTRPLTPALEKAHEENKLPYFRSQTKSDPWSNIDHNEALEQIAAARGTRLLVSVKPGNARGYGFGPAATLQDLVAYYNQIMEAITDDDGQVRFLRAAGIPHKIKLVYGSWEGLEPSLEINVYDTNFDIAVELAQILGDAFLQDAVIVAKSEFEGQQFGIEIKKPDGSPYSVQEITEILKKVNPNNDPNGINLTTSDDLTGIRFFDNRYFENPDEYNNQKLEEFASTLKEALGDGYHYKSFRVRSEYREIPVKRGGDSDPIGDLDIFRRRPYLQRIALNELYKPVWRIYSNKYFAITGRSLYGTYGPAAYVSRSFSRDARADARWNAEHGLAIRRDGKVPLTRWGNTRGREVADPEYFGGAAAGREKARVGPGFLKRTYWGLPGYVREEVVPNKARYFTLINPEDLYDWDHDPLAIKDRLMADHGVASANAVTTEVEQEIKRLGYKGYWAMAPAGPVAATFEPIYVTDVTDIPLVIPDRAGYDEKGTPHEPTPKVFFQTEIDPEDVAQQRTTEEILREYDEKRAKLQEMLDERKELVREIREYLEKFMKGPKHTPLFQEAIEGEKSPRLLAIHNTGPDKILLMKQLGGVPALSIAVVREGQPFTGFGDITLIAKPHLGKPEETAVFGSDVWTRRLPEIREQYAIPVNILEIQNWANTFSDIEEVVDILSNIMIDADELGARLDNGVYITEDILEELRENLHLIAENEQFREAAYEDGTTPEDLLQEIEDSIFGMSEEVLFFRNPDTGREEILTLDKLAAYMIETSEEEIIGQEVPGYINSAIVRGILAGRMKDTEQLRAFVDRFQLDWHEIERKREHFNRLLQNAKELWLDFFDEPPRDIEFFFHLLVAIHQALAETHPELTNPLESDYDITSEAVEDLLLNGRGFLGHVYGILEDRSSNELMKHQFRQIMDDEDKLELFMPEVAGMYAIQLHMPVPYAEAKPQSIQTIDDFAAAIVPHSSIWGNLQHAPYEYREAIQYLQENGLEILTYGDEDERVALTYQMAEKLGEKGTPVYFQRDARYQGMFDPATRIITLFRSKNKSTLIHELAHYFLTTLLEMEQVGRLSLRDQKLLEDVRTWLGVEPGMEFTVEQHETFARAFEAYLMEGKAPSPRLVRAFETFMAWLKAIYRSIRPLEEAGKFEFNKEVKHIFDRILAADEEIESALSYYENVGGIREEVEKILKLSEEQRAKIREARQKARERAYRTRRERLIKAYLRAIGGKKHLLEEAKKEVNTNPVYQAMDSLAKRGLNAQEVGEIVGEENLALLRKKRVGLIRKEGGIPLSLAAEEFGFKSANDLLTAILEAPSKAEAVEEVFERKLREAEEEIVKAAEDPDAILAEEDLHNDERLQLIVETLANFEKSRGMPQHLKDARIRAKMIKEAAREQIAKLPIKQAIKYSRFAAEERLARRKAIEAAKRGDDNAVRRWLDQEAMAHAMTMVSIEARTKIDKIRRRIKQAPKAKIADAWQQQMYRVLARMGMVDKSLVQPDTPSLALFLDMVGGKDQDELSAPVPAWSDFLLNEQPIDLNSLTWGELEELDDFFKWVIGRGRDELTGRLLTYDKPIEEVVEDLIQPMVEMKGKPVIPEDKHPILRRWSEAFKRYIAEHEILGFILDAADGFQLIKKGKRLWHGPNYEMHLKLERAQNEYDRLVKDILAKLDEPLSVLKAYVKRYGHKAVPTKVPVPEILAAEGKTWTAEKILAVALNMGNDENLHRLISGYGLADPKTLAPGEIPQVLWDLTESLGDAEWKAIQQIWDIIDSLWPKVSEVHQQLNHFRIRKVPARPFKTPSGLELRGGYYPAKYDPELSKKVGEWTEKDDLINRNEAIFQTPSAKSSFTKARTGGAGRPLQLSLTVLLTHLDDVARYVTHAPVLRDVDRLTQHKKYEKEFTRVFGRETYRMIRPALKHIARPTGEIGGILDKWADRERARATTYTLALNFSVAAKQMFSLPGAVRDIGVRNYVRGVARVLQNPLEMRRLMREASPYMETRSKSFDRELADSLKSFTHLPKELAGFSMKDVRNMMFALIKGMDFLTVFPVWIGAYEAKMQETGGNVTEAVEYADTMVRMSQPSAKPIDLNHFMRSKLGFHRILSFFMTFVTKYGNRQRHFYRAFRQGQISTREYLTHLFVEAMAPPVLMNLMFSAIWGTLEEDWEDPEDKLWELLGDILAYQFTGYLILRDLAAGLIAELFPGDRYKANPWDSPIWAGTKLLYNVIRKISKGDPEELAMAVAEIMSYYLQVPAPKLARKLIEGYDQYKHGKGTPLNILIPNPKEK